MSDSKTEQTSGKLKPPFGSVPWYSDFLKLAKRIKVDKVDVQYLRTHEISSKGNESKVVNGLKFLGLINEDGTATEKMKSLGFEGEEFQKNLENIIREAYAVLLDKVKDLEKAKPQDIINCLKGDYYQMAPTTAQTGAQVFVFLAQKAEIPLSQEIIDELAVSEERKKVARKPRAQKPSQEPQAGQIKDKLSEEVLARLTLKDVGYVDVKDKDTFQIAKAYWNVLSKKLGITEEKEN
jgi:hypothetical protein